MKRTDMLLCVGKKNGYDVWRTVYTTGDHYFVRWNGSLMNVDDDIKNHYTAAKQIERR